MDKESYEILAIVFGTFVLAGSILLAIGFASAPGAWNWFMPEDIPSYLKIVRVGVFLAGVSGILFIITFILWKRAD